MKVRMDFVTNSSSSSFLLVIRIGLKDGNVLKFKGEGGVGEGDEEYYELHANEDPQRLGECETIDELIEMLKSSVVQGGDYYEEGEPVFTDDDTFIQELKKIDSMNDVATITINGDVFGSNNQHQYGHYTYYRDTGITVYDEGGEEVYSEGEGGSLGFSVPGFGIQADNFGSALTDNYEYFDDDISSSLPVKTTEDGSFIIVGAELVRYKGSENNVIIPEGITRIGNNAFENCDAINSVIIPEGVVEIGKEAFIQCANLTCVEMPDSITRIGEHAFTDCSELKTIKLPAGITEIETETFAGCTHLTSIEIPNSITIIGERVFSGCEALTDVCLPDNIESIGTALFESSGMKTVKIPACIDYLSDFMYTFCAELTKVIIPAHITRLGDCAFSHCKNIEEVCMPDGIKEIGEGAFYGCEKLIEINIPASVTKIKKEAFASCNNVTLVVAKDSYAEKHCQKNNVKYRYLE